MTLALAAFLALVGLVARLAYAPEILDEGGPHLIPADSHYYLRFAQLQEDAFPSFRRFDPLVNFPSGAEILWPPIHTWLVRVAILVAGSPASPEAGAIWVGPACYLLWLLLLAALTRRWHGSAASLWMIAALALPPLAARAGDLGQLDHHVHEGPWIALILLLAHRLALRPDTRMAVGLGVALALGRLLTTSGFLGVPLAAMALVGVALLRRAERLPPAPRAWSAGVIAVAVCAAAQWATAWAWGAPRSLDYTQLGGFHPLWTLACFGGALGIQAGLEKQWGRTILSSGVALAAGSLVALSLRTGLGDAMRADEVLSAASESRPLWGDPLGAMTLMGQGWLLWAAAGLWAIRGLPGDPDCTRALRLALALSVPMLLVSLFQIRLTRLGLGAMAFSVALALPSLVEHLRRGVRPPLLRAAGVLMLLLSLALLLPRGRVLNYEERHLRPTLSWLERHSPAVDKAAPEWSVLSTWTFGHLITAWSGRAAIATPFSQAPVHVAGNARALAILSERDDARAYDKALKARVRYVLAAPYRGTVGPEEHEDHTLMARLLEVAGMPQDGESTAHFRLVHESEADRNREEGGPLARIFEVVQGASLALRGPPLATVTVGLRLRSDRGEDLTYRRRVRLDESGRGVLRVPYPTETDPGATVHAAAPYRISVEGAEGPLHATRVAQVDVTLAAVRDGRLVEVDLDPSRELPSVSGAP